SKHAGECLWWWHLSLEAKCLYWLGLRFDLRRTLATQLLSSIPPPPCYWDRKSQRQCRKRSNTCKVILLECLGQNSGTRAAPSAPAVCRFGSAKNPNFPKMCVHKGWKSRNLSRFPWFVPRKSRNRAKSFFWRARISAGPSTPSTSFLNNISVSIL